MASAAHWEVSTAKSGISFISSNMRLARLREGVSALRALVLIDGQNLFHLARIAWVPALADPTSPYW